MSEETSRSEQLVTALGKFYEAYHDIVDLSTELGYIPPSIQVDEITIEIDDMEIDSWCNKTITEVQQATECEWCHKLADEDKLKDTSLGKLCEHCIADIISNGTELSIYYNRK